MIEFLVAGVPRGAEDSSVVDPPMPGLEVFTDQAVPGAEQIHEGEHQALDDDDQPTG